MFLNRQNINNLDVYFSSRENRIEKSFRSFGKPSKLKTTQPASRIPFNHQQWLSDLFKVTWICWRMNRVHTLMVPSCLMVQKSIWNLWNNLDLVLWVMFYGFHPTGFITILHHYLGEYFFFTFFQPPNNLGQIIQMISWPDSLTAIRKVCFPSGMRNILQSPLMLAIALWSFLVKSCRAWNSSRRSKRWVERYCWWFKNPAFTSSGW